MKPDRRRISITLALTAVVASAGFVHAQSGGAGGTVARAVGGFTSSEHHREIPAVAARALIAAHHADVINGSVDAALVTLVLDANNNYVASAVSQVAVAARSSDGGTASAGGFVSGGAVARATVAPSAATASSGSASPATAGTINIGGIGAIDTSTIDEMFVSTYAAGDIAPAAVRVRFIILKK